MIVVAVNVGLGYALQGNQGCIERLACRGCTVHIDQIDRNGDARANTPAEEMLEIGTVGGLRLG